MRHWNILCAALNDLYRCRSRSVVVLLCLTTIVFPFLTALAISEGIRFQAELSVKEGADIHVSRHQSDAPGSVDVDVREQLAQLPGVSRVAARVVGRTYVVDRVVALVGVERASLASLGPIVRGRVPESRGEVLIGHGMAQRFGIQPGLPFTLAANNRKVFRASGILAQSCLWGSDLLVMHHNDANEFFRIEGKATDLLIYTMSDSGSVAQAITEHEANRRHTESVSLTVKERRISLEKLRSAYSRSHGVFAVLLIVGLTLTLPAVVVTCGLGQNEMRREMGVLKAIGWPTRALVEKAVFENLAISLAAVCLSVLVCMAWMKGLNGIFLAQFYVAEVGVVPDMEIPSRVLPTHPLLAFMFAMVVTQLAGLFSVWRGTRMPPKESIR